MLRVYSVCSPSTSDRRNRGEHPTHDNIHRWAYPQQQCKQKHAPHSLVVVCRGQQYCSTRPTRPQYRPHSLQPKPLSPLNLCLSSLSAVIFSSPYPASRLRPPDMVVGAILGHQTKPGSQSDNSSGYNVYRVYFYSIKHSSYGILCRQKTARSETPFTKRKYLACMCWYSLTGQSTRRSAHFTFGAKSNPYVPQVNQGSCTPLALAPILTGRLPKLRNEEAVCGNRTTRVRIVFSRRIYRGHTSDVSRSGTDALRVSRRALEL